MKVDATVASGKGRLTHAARRSVPIWSVLIAVLVLVASIMGLTDPDVYGQETVNWATQAKGQDVGNLLAVVVLLVSAAGYRRGSARAGLVWLGALLYLVYAFVVYAVAVHLNDLFLVYVAVLGLSAWAVIFHVGALRREPVTFPAGRTRRTAAAVIAAVGVLFGGLWLGELVPALLIGEVPASLVEAGLWVNPIHVVDLSMVLPAFVLTGVAAWRGRGWGLFWLAPWLVFSVLMGTSIVAAMLLMAAGGESGTLPPIVMVSVVVLASLAAAVVYLGRAHESRPTQPHTSAASSSLRLSSTSAR